MLARTTGRLALAATLAWIAGPPVTAQRDFASVEIRTVPVVEGVYMLQGAGGNLGLSVGPDGAVLVDDQFAPLTEKIVAAVGKVSPKPIRFVVNTHWHGDHTGGNENLGRAGAVVVAHENVRRRMSVEQFSAAFQSTQPPAPQGALPIVTFTDSVSFHLNGIEVRAIHVDPAHTDGDSLIHFVGPNVLHMGDVYFSDSYPYIDVDSGGTIHGVLEAVDVALGIADPATRIIPGHGPLSDRAGLVAYRDLLRELRDRIAALIRAGKSREEVVAAKPTAPFDAQWGGGFMKPDLWVSIVYRDLSR